MFLNGKDCQPDGTRIECERKFLVMEEIALARSQGHEPVQIQQIYLDGTGDWAIRSRRTEKDGAVSYTTTMKRAIAKGSSIEIEEQGTAETHKQFLLSAGMVLEKTRYKLPLGASHVLEVDFFKDLLDGMALVEIELGSLDDDVPLPAWLAYEVTGDGSYSNKALFDVLKGRRPHPEPPISVA